MQRRLSARWKRNEMRENVRGRKAKVQVPAEGDPSLLDTLLSPLSPLNPLQDCGGKEIVDCQMPGTDKAEMLKRRTSTCSTAPTVTSSKCATTDSSRLNPESRCGDRQNGRRRIFGDWASKDQALTPRSRLAADPTELRDSARSSEFDSVYVVEVPVDFASFFRREMDDGSDDVSSLSSNDSFCDFDDGSAEGELCQVGEDENDVSSCWSASDGNRNEIGHDPRHEALCSGNDHAQGDGDDDEDTFHTSQSCVSPKTEATGGSGRRRSIFKKWKGSDGEPFVYPRAAVTAVEANTAPQSCALPEIPQCVKNDPLVRDMMLRNLGVGDGVSEGGDMRRPVIFGRVGQNARCYGSAHVWQAPSPSRRLRKTASTTALMPHRSLRPTRSCLRAVQAYSCPSSITQHQGQAPTRKATVEESANTSRTPKRLVTFQSYVDVLEFEKPLEVWADKDWAKWFA